MTAQYDDSKFKDLQETLCEYLQTPLDERKVIVVDSAPTKSREEEIVVDEAAYKPNYTPLEHSVIPTGFKHLDEKFSGGIKRGELAIITSGPSVSKSDITRSLVDSGIAYAHMELKRTEDPPPPSLQKTGGRRTGRLGVGLNWHAQAITSALNATFDNRYRTADDNSEIEKHSVGSLPEMLMAEAAQHAFLTLVGVDRDRATYLVMPSGKYSVQHLPITPSLQEALSAYLEANSLHEDDMEGLRVVVSIVRPSQQGLKKYLEGSEETIKYNILSKK